MPSVRCDAFGAVLPLAYAPRLAYDAQTTAPPSPALPYLSVSFMQLAVTQCICKGTVLVFRFYPQSDGYQSSSSVTFCFALATDVTTQSTFQLRYHPNPTQIELWVVGVVGYFVIAATPVASQIVPATASCAVAAAAPPVARRRPGSPAK